MTLDNTNTGFVLMIASIMAQIVLAFDIFLSLAQNSFYEVIILFFALIVLRIIEPKIEEPNEAGG